MTYTAIRATQPDGSQRTIAVTDGVDTIQRPTGATRLEHWPTPLPAIWDTSGLPEGWSVPAPPMGVTCFADRVVSTDDPRWAQLVASGDISDEMLADVPAPWDAAAAKSTAISQCDAWFAGRLWDSTLGVKIAIDETTRGYMTQQASGLLVLHAAGTQTEALVPVNLAGQDLGAIPLVQALTLLASYTLFCAQEVAIDAAARAAIGAATTQAEMDAVVEGLP
jgi:hypothetical protein